MRSTQAMHTLRGYAPQTSIQAANLWHNEPVKSSFAVKQDARGGP